MAMKKRPAKRKAAAKKKSPAKRKAAAKKKPARKKRASAKSASVTPTYFGSGVMKWPYSQLVGMVPFYQKHGLDAQAKQIVDDNDFMVEAPAAMIDGLKRMLYESGLADTDPVAEWIVTCPCELPKFMP